MTEHTGGTSGDAAVVVASESDPDKWMSRCRCGVVTCEAGTYDEAVAALEKHRAEATGP